MDDAGKDDAGAAAAADLQPNVLPVADTIMDLAFLATQTGSGAAPFSDAYGSGTGSWECYGTGKLPTGHQGEILPGLHKQSKRRGPRKAIEEQAATEIPFSVLEMMRKRIGRDVFSTALPIFTERSCGLLAEIWHKSLQHMTAIPDETIDHTPFEETVSLASVEHDNINLRYGRISRKTGATLPLCRFASERSCQAVQIPSNQGPLHVYTTPEQEREFQENGTVCQGPCILCYRTLAHKLALAAHGGAQVCFDVHRLTIMPTRALIDVPGGYNRKAVLTPQDAPITAPFVKSSGKLRVCYDEKHDDTYSGWYIDQSDIVFRGAVSPLN